MEVEETGVVPEEAAEETESAPVEGTEGPEDQEPESGDRPKGKTPKWAEKRFAELTRQREEANRRAELAEQRLHELYTKPKQEEPDPPQQTRPRPTREQFDFDDEKFIDALTDWKLEQAEAKREHARYQQEWETSQRQHLQTFEQKREATVNQGREKFEDFDDLVMTMPENVMTVELAAAIFETEKPAEVAYFLGKNRAEAARIAALSPLKKAVELGKIEAKLATPPPKKQTSAPPPVAPVGGNAPAGAEPDPAKDPEGWLTWERARVKSLGRRY